MNQAKTEENVEEAMGDINGDVVFKNLDFTEKTIRRGFIRKVYGILMVQLLITGGFMSIFMFVEPVKMFAREQAQTSVIVAMITIIVIVVIMMCSTNARRKAPGNYIFLTMFTLGMSFLLGIVSAASDRDEIFIALGICALVTFGLTVFAWQTKYDFTMCHGALFTLLLTLTAVGIGMWFLPTNRESQLMLAGFGAFVFSLLLIHDTQIIIGGNHHLAISPEEYVFAALTLYLDIINLFLRILRIIRLA